MFKYFYIGTVGPLNTAAVVGLAVSTATVVSFIAGVLVGALAGILLYHCFSKHRSQSSKTDPTSHQQQQAASTPNPLQQTGPEYEEVVELRQNMAYGPTETGSEMRENEAYQPMQD